MNPMELEECHKDCTESLEKAETEEWHNICVESEIPN